MKNPVVLICSICTLVCAIIFIDGVANFSTLPTYQFVMRAVSLVMASVGLFMSLVGTLKQ